MRSRQIRSLSFFSFPLTKHLRMRQEMERAYAHQSSHPGQSSLSPVPFFSHSFSPRASLQIPTFLKPPPFAQPLLPLTRSPLRFPSPPLFPLHKTPLACEWASSEGAEASPTDGRAPLEADGGGRREVSRRLRSGRNFSLSIPSFEEPLPLFFSSPFFAER
jgi:hypothetical protein